MKNKVLKIKLRPIVIIFGIALLTTGCSPTDNPIEDELQELEVIGSLTAKVNGEDFTASRLIIAPTLVGSVTFTDNGYLLNISAFDIQLNFKRTKSILLFISGFDFDEVVVGTKFNTPNLFSFIGFEPGAYAFYVVDLDTDDNIDGTGTETIEEISIEITAIDRDKQLISGKFSFKGTDEDTITVYQITDGIFTDVGYEVQ